VVDERVLVIGSAGVDVKGRPDQEAVWGSPNIGYIRSSIGGVARNIAENLARLEVQTTLLTAVGDDTAGQNVIDACEEGGINCDYVRSIAEARTGTYMALLKPDGQLHTAISDFDVMAHVDSDYLLEHEGLVENADLIVIDATIHDDVLETLFELTARHNIRVAADPTTPALASKLCPYIPQLYMVAPNAGETVSLCNLKEPAHDRDTAISTARSLVTLGAHIAVVTMGEDGLAYAHGGGAGFLRAIQTNVVDTNGAGDAFSAATIFGLLNDVPIDEAMRLGITAASLTLESPETVLPNLSQELLYDELMA
jgi:pseudouridine kinase